MGSLRAGRDARMPLLAGRMWLAAGIWVPTQRGIRGMRLSQGRRAVSVRFDDPNLVSCAGLAAVMALATRCGLARLLTERVQIAVTGGANATSKILALGAGVGAGAGWIRSHRGGVHPGHRAPAARTHHRP